MVVVTFHAARAPMNADMRVKMSSAVGPITFSARFSAPQHVVHLRDDVGSVGRRRDAQEVVFLEVLRGVVAKPLFDLVREAVQVSVAIDVECGKISTRSGHW